MTFRFTPKMWASAGLLVAAAVSVDTSVVAADAKPAAQTAEVPNEFHGDFTKALGLMLMGEGGEGGIGLTNMWPTVSAPALNSAQVDQALRGNTLAIPNHYTMQFHADGTIGGYDVKLGDVPVKKCPVPEVLGDGYVLHEGECYSRTLQNWAGSWKVKDNQVCVDIKWREGAMNECYYVAFLLDRVALFQAGGKMFGKANSLKRGATTDE